MVAEREERNYTISKKKGKKRNKRLMGRGRGDWRSYEL
jgi:hypothetical protein